jgi:RNA polymerase I-specific transcription initiation factor RRN6
MDIDAVFSALQVTLDSFVRRSPEADGAALPLARFLTSSSFFGLPEATGGQALIEGTSFPSLTEIYDRLIEEWLVPLPKAAPDKYRVTTERMIRIITIGLYLASIGVQLRISTSAEPAIPLSFTRAGPSRGEEIQLSVRTRSGAKDKGKERETEAKSPGGSAPLPPLGTAVRGADDGDRHGQGPSSDPMSSLPTPGATPPAGSHASAAGSEAGEIEEDPASVRLRAYTSLNPQPQLAKPMRKILSGWVDGGDPSNYTWKPLHAPDRDGSDDEDDDGDDAASSSLSVAEQRRRRRRWQKRLRREQQLQQSQSQSVASGSASTLPPLLAFKPWGSQPVRSSTNLNPNGGSSSQAFKEGNTREEQLPMTQAEPGTFGSRQAVTVKGQEQRKKRRRAAGF